MHLSEPVMGDERKAQIILPLPAYFEPELKRWKQDLLIVRSDLAEGLEKQPCQAAADWPA
jgi:hypothetical protein